MGWVRWGAQRFVSQLLNNLQALAVYSLRLSSGQDKLGGGRVKTWTSERGRAENEGDWVDGGRLGEGEEQRGRWTHKKKGNGNRKLWQIKGDGRGAKIVSVCVVIKRFMGAEEEGGGERSPTAALPFVFFELGMCRQAGDGCWVRPGWLLLWGAAACSLN